jgi:hypothetical protein
MLLELEASHETLVDFTIPLADASKLINGAREVVIAAASATLFRRGYFGHSKPRAAREHAESVRMGQTRRGSYVIPIISRLPGEDISSHFEEERLELETSVEPFGRQVMVGLARSLGVVQELAVGQDREPSMRQLNESVEIGVSSELCGGVASMLEADAVGNLQVTFEWARRIPEPQHVPAHVDFPQDVRPVLSRMSERLRQSDVVAEQQIVGYVRSLKRDEDEENGTVTVRAATGRIRRDIKMVLGPADYEQATQANNERRPVMAMGTLRRESGKALWLTNVRHFGFAQFLYPDEPGRAQ